MTDVSPVPPSSFHERSPLETLVRKTSSRRTNAPAATRTANSPSTVHSLDPYDASEMISSGRFGVEPPISPLLHGHFSRNSTATSSSNDNNSYLASVRTSTDSRNYYANTDHYRYYDDESVYSSITEPAIRDSWQSNQSSRTVTRTPLLDGTMPPNDSSPLSSIPTVVISSPSSQNDVSQQRTGRTPVVRSETSNFSRPIRPSLNSEESEARKREVLERNARRAVSPHSSMGRPSAEGLRSQSPSGSASSPNLSSRSRSPLRHEIPGSNIDSDNNFSSRGAPMIFQRSTSSSRQQPHDPLPNPYITPLRPSSPASSLYSTSYSFYDLNGSQPDLTYLEVSSSDFTRQPRAAPTPPPPRTPSPSSRPAAMPSSSAPTQPKTAQEFLQLGIQHHEANRLKDSAVCFERSAQEGGGCGVGMLMYGLTLRHGWGCEKNEKVGFKWLSKAAEIAVKDLEDARSGGLVDTSAVQSELVLAIYEVGQCFFHGWGVVKDQKMGVSYYTVAARLGDADAQNDLAFCLANGKGCKKDKKEAAKWYRAAVAQGQSDIGLAWIYKEKYQ